ncbi:hypothetical protein C8R43DRAFT_952183 [Mycena crocata]|nr:hypothetical protein C8R43DRAFT_952183 [Mycena crocata]
MPRGYRFRPTGTTPRTAPDRGSTAANIDVPVEMKPIFADENNSTDYSMFYDADEEHCAAFGEPIDSDPMDVDEPEDNAAEVDEFLASIDLPAAPAQVPRRYDYRPSKPRLIMPVDQPVNIKPWSWTGRLTIRAKDAAQVDIVCEKATLTDATEASPPRIASFVWPKKDLHFEELYDLQDLPMFLPGCKPPHQFARLEVDEKGDIQSFTILTEYMARKELAALVAAKWDEKTIGHLVFIPTSAKSLLAQLGIPPSLPLTAGPSLIAVLPPKKPYRHFPRFNLSALKTTRELELEANSPGSWRKSLHLNPAYHIALRILQPPPQFRQFVFDNLCAVWPLYTRSDGNSQLGADDRDLLLCLLEKSTPGIGGVVPAMDPGARVVFIHVSALRNIHNLPLLAQRRLNPKVILCLYGMDPAVPRSRWGFREIYPIGGVVTFTPEALTGDAWGVLRTIRKIHAHPAWECFLAPEAVGMALRLDEVREPNNDATEPPPNVLALDLIFDAILAGQVALMHAPPTLSSCIPNPVNEPVIAVWVKTHSLLRPLTKPTLLAHCRQAFVAVYDTFHPSEWVNVAKNNILKNMRRMQVQPAMVDAYRRFVVLDVVPDAWHYNGADGIEWNSVQEFQFRDNFLNSMRDDQVL